MVHKLTPLMIYDSNFVYSSRHIVLQTLYSKLVPKISFRIFNDPLIYRVGA